MKRILQCAAVSLLLATFNFQLATAFAQGTAFTYQGRLNASGAVANGLYDFRFRLDADPVGNTILDTLSTNAIGVTNGLFTTTIDFGAGWFNGSNYWLEVDVRTNGSVSYTQLNPFQSLTPTPYAIFATTASNVSGTLPAAQITGALPVSQLSGTLALTQLPGTVLTNGEGGVSLTGSFTGNAGGLTNLSLAGISPAGTFSNLADAFAPAIPLPVGMGPFHVAVADINGDGKLDLISAGNFDNTLTVLTNNGSGGFALSATLYGYNPIPVVVADMNGDGKPDLICGNANNTLQVFTNNGSGGFVSAGQFNVGGWPFGIAVADVNGDGKPDLISANFYQTNTLTVLTNNGSGGWGFNATLIVGNEPNSVVAMDVNNDGKPDLVCANYNDGTLTVLTNNGHGGFVFNTTVPAGIGPASLLASDINGDGKLDLIWASGGGYVMVYTNNGNGGFGQYASPSVGGYPAFGVAVADINGDGKLDLISANSGGNNLTVLTNSGNGGFGIYAIPAVGSNPQSVVAADVNGDGKVDLVSANVQDGTLSLLFNLSPAVTAAGGFTGYFTGNGSGMSDLNAAALNGSIPPALLTSVPAGSLTGSIPPSSLTSVPASSLTGSVPPGLLTSVPAGSLTGILPASVIPPTLSLTSLNVDQPNQNIGNVYSNALTFGLNSGEGIASKRNGVNIYDLEFFTGFSNRMTILSNGNVGINTNNPGANTLLVNGGAQVTGLIRAGSETGTTEAPLTTGILNRRINSIAVTTNEIVAATDLLTLERDGSAGGFHIRYQAVAGTYTIACMGINSSGTPVNFFTSFSPGGTAGIIQVYSNAQNIVHFECTFGDTYDVGGTHQLTQATLSRANGDTYWGGFVTSTYNQ